MRWRVGVLVVVGALVAAEASADETVLYDGANGLPPEGQGFLTSSAFPPGTYYTIGGSGITFDTTVANAIQAGFHNYDATATAILNPSFPTLDRPAGFSVSLDARVLIEAHANNDRAGLSVIVLANDLLGIELAFWTDRVWAQSGPSFTHAEEAPFDTTAAVRRYDVVIQGSSYSLKADGTEILSGLLRDMSSFGAPYNRARFLFVGDDTTSARARAELRRLAVSIPDPPPSGQRFHTVPPCRVVDTRDLGAPVGGPALAGLVPRTVAVSGACGIPTSAQAVSFNVTVTQAGADGNLRVYPGGQPTPLVSAINYTAGQTRANNGVVGLGPGGAIVLLASQDSATSVHAILDVNGYFE